MGQRITQRTVLRGFPLVRLLLVLAIIAGASLYTRCAHAQALPAGDAVGLQYGTRVVTVAPGTITGVGAGAGRAWAANMTNGAVTVTDSFTARIAANDVAMSASRTIPWAKVLTGAAKALPWVALTAAVYEFWDMYHCKALAGNTSQIGCAEGVAQTTQSCNGWGVVGGALPTSIPFTCSAATWCQGRRVQVGAAYGVYQSNTCFTTNGAPFGQPGAVLVEAADMSVTHPGTETLCPSGTITGKSSYTVDPRCFKSDGTDTYTPQEFDTPRPGVVFDPTLPAYYSPAEIAKGAAATGKVDFAPDALPGAILGPNPVLGPTTTVTDPSGTTTTRPQYDIQYPPAATPFPALVPWTETSVKTNPDGTTQTTTNPQEQETCGLPGKPECNVKVDEQGTPTDKSFAPQQATVDASRTDAINKINDAGSSTGKNTSWSFTFALPTGCSAIPTPAFAPYFTALDLCPYQSVFHDLMSLVWFGATFWSIVGMVGRTLQGT